VNKIEEERTDTGWVVQGPLLIYDQHWQVPARTEQHAFATLAKQKLESQYWQYIAFPWATLIDCIERDVELALALQLKLEEVVGVTSGMRVFTVCQHIKFRKHLNLFSEVGITDIFASHATKGERRIDGINIHPFPLFAAQAEDRSDAHGLFTVDDFVARPYLYSFAGAFNPAHYLTQSRAWIFDLPSREDAPIIRRDQWHFEKRVYDEQVYGREVSGSDAATEFAAQVEYVDMLQKTRFALCPSGTGPNSIRLWEAIEFGSIPVILADDLALPGKSESWAEACIFLEESKEQIETLPDYLETLSKDRDQLHRKLEALRRIRDSFGLSNFAKCIVDTMKAVDQSSIDWSNCRWRIYLDQSRLTKKDTNAWVAFLEEAATIMGGRAGIIVGSGQGAHGAPWLHAIDWSREDVVHLSDARTLSTGLFRNYRSIYISPSSQPSTVNPTLALEAIAVGTDTEIGCMNLWQPLCTLATSVFNGDDYITPFLQNALALQRYDDIEHIIVLANSPGKEYEIALEHCSRNPSVVVVWRSEDPGLYNIWNHCHSLASAPYMGNANLDDKRAPNHVLELVRLLDTHPECDVASAGLRVTHQASTTWEQSNGLEEWYTSDAVSIKKGTDLYRVRSGTPVAHNFPHCLPIWRTSLGSAIGSFNESRFGPSADWEYWLRAAQRDTRFITHNEALGLYYLAPQSYWRRNSEAPSYDRHIARTYIESSGALLPFVDAPAGLRFKRCLEAIEGGELLHFLVSFADISWDLQRNKLHGEKLEALVEYLCETYLGIPDPATIAGRCLRSESPTPQQLIRYAVDFLVEALHTAGPIAEKHCVFINRICADYYRTTGSVEAILLMSLVARARCDTDRQTSLLRVAYERHSSNFFAAFSSIYRFTLSLDALADLVPKLPQYCRSIAEPSSRLFYFPDYTHGNPYQRLLYEHLANSTCETIGIDERGIEDFWDTDFRAGDTFHIHWLNSLFKGFGVDQHAGVIERFLDGVRMLQKKSVTVIWTIHNLYNHEVLDRDLERHFRKELSAQVDKVLLHHPKLLVELSEWLHPKARIELLEHGSYIGFYENTISAEQARISLGFSSEDVVIVVFGQIRPYKDLNSYIPALENAMQYDPRLKLLIAGKIGCDLTEQAIRQIPTEQIKVVDRFIDDDEYQTFLNASSFALLTYKQILTSGSLFQAFSFAKPVLAPDLGSIPAYVVNGFNGYTYTQSDFSERLTQIISLSKAQNERMSSNARLTAESLQWPGPRTQ